MAPNQELNPVAELPGGGIRKACISDLDVIVQLYDKARAEMRRQGNLTQWPGTYPGRDNALADLEAGTLYVNDSVTAVMTLAAGPDPTYARIRQGSWLDEDSYSVIHRIVSTQPGQGRALLQYAMDTAGHIRIDTHRKNRSMLRLLEKLGFRHCGVITCQDGTDREAFEWSSKPGRPGDDEAD